MPAIPKSTYFQIASLNPFKERTAYVENMIARVVGIKKIKGNLSD
jgi:hypothetical protein